MSEIPIATEALRALEAALQLRESEHLEFKEARRGFHFDDLIRYCAAFANEGGGALYLGVANKPRRVVGTQAYRDLEETRRKLLEALRLRIEADEIEHPDGRVVMFAVPSRPVGMPIQHRGSYWMRSGGSLVAMTADQMKRILDEAGPDYSAEICGPASVSDLHPEAIHRFRQMWRRKSGNPALDGVSDLQLLADAELVTDSGATYAALVLMGTREALGRHLAQAETIFEYRANETDIPAAQRKEYREGFFLWYDDLWSTIGLRNEVQQLRDGLFVLDIKAFNEGVVREAVLNAVSHRDYRLGGSVFVRQFPRTLEIVSPGGFPPGVTPENILDRQSPRNRRVAEALQRCGLVERSGQGADRMFEGSIGEGKPAPDFTGSDGHQVSLTLRGEVRDPRFVRFLERLRQERLAFFSAHDLLVLDHLQRGMSLPEQLGHRVPALLEAGALERVGRGRGTRYILSRGLYGFVGEKGVYTRKRGLDHETNKELLVRHLQDSARHGSPLGELLQVLPSLSRGQVQGLLRELRQEGRVHCRGVTRAGRWYSGPDPD